MARLRPDQRRQRIIDATLAVAIRKGLGTTTVRDVAAEMGTSSGLIHHYFSSMDHVLAASFEQAAQSDLDHARSLVAAASEPADALTALMEGYTSDDGTTMQLWLDAWSEASRRPVLQEVSRRLNLAWHRLLVEVIERGVESGQFTCADPVASAWRILSVLDGMALQSVAHGEVVDHADASAWSAAAAALELGLPTDRASLD